MKFTEQLEIMEAEILRCLDGIDRQYALRKRHISDETGIPVDVLTVLLKRLREKGLVHVMVVWSESTCTPAGSGYCLTSKNPH